ncbi:MAG: glycosyltransferase family 9 protein [Verrucomicrobiae bacterium]|nr:glycosyltransferase family 9 protein [Verrucomicrobiae bacterium]
MSVVAAKKKRFALLLRNHLAALGYVLRVVLPVILRTGKRPVIFSRLTGMGDIICTIPAVKLLRERHPGAYFIYNCHSDFAEVPRLAGGADRITSLVSTGQVGHWYRFLLGEFYHFAHGDDTPGKVATEPMVSEFCRQFNLPVTEEHPKINASTAAHEKLRVLLAQKNLDADRLVLIHPGPSWPVKEWPREYWTALVAGLRERGFTSIAQLGVGRYMNFGKVAVEPVPGAVSLVDELSIEDCFAAIGRAKLFVGIDSGLLHIAACTRTPAVALWGSTSPQFFYAPAVRRDFVVSDVDCQGCYHRLPRLHWITGCPYDIRCMRGVRVEDVLRACLARLKPELVAQ